MYTQKDLEEAYNYGMQEAMLEKSASEDGTRAKASKALASIIEAAKGYGKAGYTAAKGYGKAGYTAAKGYGKAGLDNTLDLIQQHPKKALGVAAGATLAALVANKIRKNKGAFNEEDLLEAYYAGLEESNNMHKGAFSEEDLLEAYYAGLSS